MPEGIDKHRDAHAERLVGGRPLQGSLAVQIGWGLVLAITAGLFEGVGRYAGYRWLMGNEEKTWSKGVMYGAWHGGFESILLVGGLAAATLLGLMAIQQAGVEAIPEAQRGGVLAQFADIAAVPS